MASNYIQPLTVNKRVRYYDGQFLQDQDLVDEQKYHVARQDQHQRTLHVAGVLEGLTAYAPSGNNAAFRIGVRAGSALDADGRLILLTPKTSTHELPKDAANSTLWLYIAYHQEPSDLQSSGQGVEGETRWEEKPYVFTHERELGADDPYQGPDWNGYLPQGDGPPPPVLLAKLTINAQGKVITADNDVRTYSGLRLPGPGADAPALRTDPRGFVGLHMVHEGALQERLTVAPSGNVGIGTTTPGNFKLRVDGDLHANKIVVQDAVNGGNTRGIWMWQAADSNWGLYMGQSGANRSLSGGTASEGAGFTSHAIRLRTFNHAGNGLIYENSAEELNFSVRASDGLTYMRGNVGIGATTPGAWLSVGGAASDSGNAGPTGDGATQLLLGGKYNAGVNQGSTNGTYKLKIEGYDNDGSVVYPIYCVDENNQADFWVKNRATEAGPPTMYFAGNVGIGTTSPNQKLSVIGAVRGANAADEAEYTEMGHGGANGYINTVGDGNLDFRHDGATKMSITDGGKVGIGTMNPSEKLEVSGNALVSGNVGIGTKNPSVKLEVSGGNIQTDGKFIGHLDVADTRNVDDTPTAFSNEIAFDFKTRDAVDAPGAGTFSGMMTFAPWRDNSGDAHHQLNFNKGGLFWRQGQPENDSWGAWSQIPHDGMSDNFSFNGRIGIGTTNPAATLHVDGEIRGKLWYSNEYEWYQGNDAVKMLHSSKCFAFLTYIRGQFEGGGEHVHVWVGQDGYWYLGGNSEQRDLAAKARCIGMP